MYAKFFSLLNGLNQFYIFKLILNVKLIFKLHQIILIQVTHLALQALNEKVEELKTKINLFFSVYIFYFETVKEFVLKKTETNVKIKLDWIEIFSFYLK